MLKRLGNNLIIKKFSNKPIIYNEKNLNLDTDLQFSKDKLVDFGELPVGEIPAPLKYSPTNKFFLNENKLKIVSEKYNTGFTTIGIYIKAGSRFEEQNGSGAANIAQKMLILGNNNVNKTEVTNFVKKLGNNIKFTMDREKIGYNITVLKEDTKEVLKLFGKLLANPSFNESQFNIEKENAYRDCINLSRDQLEQTLDSVHNTAFNDHQMGQPLKGNRDRIKDLKFEQLNSFVKSRLYQSNIVVVGLGELDHENFEKDVNENFSNIEKFEHQALDLYTTEKPGFTSTLTFMRDDEMVYVNSGIFFKGPKYDSKDTLALKFLVEMVGEYRIDEGVSKHVNTTNRQYNYNHHHLAECPDILLHKALYLPYSDVSLIGGYGYGNEIFCNKILFYTQMVFSEFGRNIFEVDVFRTRAKLFNDLLNQYPNNDLLEEIANQAFYLERRVDRTEQATRYSHLANNEHLKKIAYKHFYDKDLAGIGWGGIHQVMPNAHYNYAWSRSTNGVGGAFIFNGS